MQRKTSRKDRRRIARTKGGARAGRAQLRGRHDRGVAYVLDPDRELGRLYNPELKTYVTGGDYATGIVKMTERLAVDCC
jgi:hypothetical protein